MWHKLTRRTHEGTTPRGGNVWFSQLILLFWPYTIKLCLLIKHSIPNLRSMKITVTNIYVAQIDLNCHAIKWWSMYCRAVFIYSFKLLEGYIETISARILSCRPRKHDSLCFQGNVRMSAVKVNVVGE